jgi:PAS domain S-box-containing protein
MKQNDSALPPVSKRVWAYWATGIVLSIGLFLTHRVQWQGGVELHTLMETVATLLAISVGGMALVRYYSKKNSMYLFIGAGFLGTAFLDGFHAIVTSAYFKPFMPSDLPSLIPWSWVASRQFLSILMVVSLLAWMREQRFGEAGRIKEKTVYISIAFFTIVSFLFFAFVPLPRAYYPEIPFHRPEEFGPALFFLIALVGYLRKGEWRHDPFEHWLVLSLIVGFIGQAAYMSFSGRIFDFEFDVAHLLKKVSYVFVLTGLMINMFRTFSAVQRSEARFSAVIDTAIDGFVTIDEYGVVTSIDPAGEQIFGYSSAELVGQNIKILTPPEIRKNHDGYLRAFAETGVGSIIGVGREVTAIRKNGSVFPMELRIAELTSVAGQGGYVAAVRDITDRKQQELALNESERRFKDFADAASDWFWEMDDKFRFSYLSNSFAQISDGVYPEDVVGKTREELGWADTEFHKWEMHQTVLNAHKPFKDFQYFFMTPRGDERRWSISGRPVFDTDGAFKGYRGVGRDVTEETKAQEELTDHRDHLESLVKERTAKVEFQAQQLESALEQEKEHNVLQSQFVAMVSHEFRTPLAIIDGTAQRMARRIEKMDGEEVMKRTTKIRDAVVRMTDLIESTLNSARMEAGTIEKHRRSVDLARLVSVICTRQQEIASSHVISVDVSAMTSPVWGDSKLLDQVFTNLLSNAVKYSPESPQIQVTGWNEDGEVVVSVRDHGLGISESDLPKLFKRYFRAGTSSGIAGTGIGLSLVKELLELQDGRVEVQSTEGEGSIFTVRLPICQAEKIPQTTDTATDEPTMIEKAV